MHKPRDCRSWVRTSTSSPEAKHMGCLLSYLFISWRLHSMCLMPSEKWGLGNWSIMWFQYLLLCNKSTPNLAGGKNNGLLVFLILWFNNSNKSLFGSCAQCINQGSCLDCVPPQVAALGVWKGPHSHVWCLSAAPPRFSPTTWSHHPII